MINIQKGFGNAGGPYVSLNLSRYKKSYHLEAKEQLHKYRMAEPQH